MQIFLYILDIDIGHTLTIVALHPTKMKADGTNGDDIKIFLQSRIWYSMNIHVV